MQLVRPLSLLFALTLAAGGCSDAATPIAAEPAKPRLDGFCTGVVSYAYTSGSVTLKVGQTKRITVHATDTGGCIMSTAGRTVTWFTSNGAVASLQNPNQLYTDVAGNAVGSATISVFVDGHGTAATATVIEASRLATLVLTPNPAQTESTRNAYFSAAGYDQYNDPFPTGTLAWSSSNTAIATINSSGVATGAGRGTVTISATSGSVTGTSPLTIIPYVLTSAPEYVYEGSYTVSSSVTPTGSYHYTWYEDVCSNGEACTGYQLTAQGTNVTSIQRSISRYDVYRRYKLDLRDYQGGPILNTAISDVSGGNELNPNSSCWPALEC